MSNATPADSTNTTSDLHSEEFWQTRARGTNSDEYQIYLDCADDGQGGDITNDGSPLKTYEEWLKS